MNPENSGDSMKIILFLRRKAGIKILALGNGPRPPFHNTKNRICGYDIISHLNLSVSY